MTSSDETDPKPVRLHDGALFSYPAIRWAFSNVRRLLPTAPVWRGPNPASVWEHQEAPDLGALTFRPIGASVDMRWEDSLAVNHTDGILVLHRGRIVYERYVGALEPHLTHLAWSVTKALVGVVSASLVTEGLLDEDALVTSILPELRETGWRGARVRDLSNMTTALLYYEDFDDPRSQVWWHLRAGGLAPPIPGESGGASFDEFMRGVGAEGQHGARFAYKTVNTDVLAWVLRRLTGKSISMLVQERIWQHLGANEDASFIVDRDGTEYAGGGFSCTLRDLARFGEMMRCDGFFNGRQIVPASTIADIRRGADRHHLAAAGVGLMANWSYRHMWWVSHAEANPIFARGMHGQGLYIDRAAEMVIARFASHPQRAGSAIDPTTLPAYETLARFLSG